MSVIVWISLFNFFIIREWITKMTRQLTVRIDFLNRESRFIGQLILIRGHAFRANSYIAAFFPYWMSFHCENCHKLSENWLHESKKLLFSRWKNNNVRKEEITRNKLHKLTLRIVQIIFTLVYTYRDLKNLSNTFRRRFTSNYIILIYIYEHQKIKY